MKFVETTGKTVDDAITAALVQLGLPSEKVDIEILSEGSKGVLGIFGAKEAKVRATAKAEAIEDVLFAEPKVKKAAPAPQVRTEKKPQAKPAADPVKKEAVAAPVKKAESAAKKEEAPVKKDVPAAKKPEAKPVRKEETRKEEIRETAGETVKAETAKASAEETNFVMESLVEDRLRAAREARASREKEAQEKESREPKEVIDYSEDMKKAEEAAKSFLIPVLTKMGLEAEIVGSAEEADVLCLDIQGENLGVIIGKRGNTLDSLQYLTSLVANKVTENYIKIKLDAENYREKRKQTLEKLAINLAKKARKTNRRVALEPMNPYERRIIHSALWSFNGVDTHSEGEEPYRKVIITPVKGNYHHK